MKIKNIVLVCSLLAGIFACKATEEGLVKDNFGFAATQLDYAIRCSDSVLAQKPTERNGRAKVIPRTIEKDGSLRVVSSHDWCSGFFPGTLWMMYEYTGDDKWRDAAARYTWSIEDAKFHRGTHDLGFMIFCPYGKAYQLTGDERYRDVALHAAKTLSTRFNPTVGCIRSWDWNRQKWQYPVIIDNLMNLELLFWATEISGDSTYHNMAVSHADKTLKHHFRPDYSSYHVINYDTITGGVISKETLQGYNDESVWSRGQAWALYGYTMCYRYTHKQEYLNCAKAVADLMLNYPGLPADLVPYWDMSDPTIPNTSRDASAACIMASGLYELSEVLPIDGARYKQKADQIVENLSGSYRAPVGTHQGFLLLHSTGNRPSNDEIDVPISYADYYYLEALLRKAALDGAK